MKGSFDLKLGRDDILKLAAQYKADAKGMELEERALEAGQKIASGELTRSNLMTIVSWKSPRSKTRANENSDEDIRDALGFAVKTDVDRGAIAVLCSLRGVGIPVASAIMTVCDPTRFTIIDVRALETLGVKQYPSGDTSYFLSYLTFCRNTAENFRVPLRDLDRALWQASKNG